LGSYSSFQDLPVWKKAMTLSLEVFRLTSVLPRSEDYGLCSQLRRAANSVGANIAEGFGRDGMAEKVQFYRISRGSAHEVNHHLCYGLNVGYFDSDTATQCIAEYENLIHEINKLVRALSNWKTAGR